MTFCCILNTIHFSLKKNSLGFRTYDNLVQKNNLLGLKSFGGRGMGQLQTFPDRWDRQPLRHQHRAVRDWPLHPAVKKNERILFKICLD